MSIKKYMGGVLVAILLVVSVSSVSALESNTGTVINIYPGIIYTQPLGIIEYTCKFVDRVQIATGYRENQSCTLVSKTNVPTSTMTFSILSDQTCPNPNNNLAKCWCSDYLLMTTGKHHYATNWSLDVYPNGSVDIVSYYGL